MNCRFVSLNISPEKKTYQKQEFIPKNRFHRGNYWVTFFIDNYIEKKISKQRDINSEEGETRNVECRE